MNCIMSMISVSGLCLCLRDTVLKLNCHLNCVDGQWLVEDEDVEGVHGVLVRHHQYFTSRLLLRR